MELNCAPDECAGDGDALLLPARQLSPSLPDHGVQLLGQLLDEVERVGLSGGRFNFKTLACFLCRYDLAYGLGT